MSLDDRRDHTNLYLTEQKSIDRQTVTNKQPIKHAHTRTRAVAIKSPAYFTIYVIFPYKVNPIWLCPQTEPFTLLLDSKPI